jgi:metabolite-proton symporter
MGQVPGEEFGWKNAVRGVVAGTIGTTIEFYDFFVYGMVASLIFDKLFFPHQSPYAGTLLALSTFAVGFVARPVGAALFGHFGDRIGRKATLMTTLILMGVGTVAIGLVPTYAQIGLWAAALLVLLRIVQGLALGGEWGGSVLISIEWERVDRWRGLFGSFPHLGTPAGMLLASAALAICTHEMSPESFLRWGWRLPFLASSVLILFGLYLRMGILESPDFALLKTQNTVARRPVIEVLRQNWREVVLTALARCAEQGPFYIFMTLVLAYGTQSLGLSQRMLLSALTMASALSLFTTPLWGFVSDLIGRRTMYAIGAAMLTLYAVPYYHLLQTRVPALVTLAIVLSLMCHDMMYGPQASMIAEVFPLRLRYSGASLGYQLASVVAGGPAPIIASFLMHQFGTPYAISAYLMVMGVTSFTAVCLLPGQAEARPQVVESVVVARADAG